ncbi:uncharacterized protein LOC114351652 [Ostrinia furnacalis]|uniref:uncharacterized protein LOC114351652 n=1 Tax=Ostrinia furnacalis TaxID=93504 RepID=UPI00103F75B5|nr:uncharacterized protein LOC114351652 [Ostrinia furnacalis]
MAKPLIFYNIKALGEITSFLKADEYYEIGYSEGETARLYILNSHVFRFYMSPTGEFREYPKPMNPGDIAKITSKTMREYGLKAFEDSRVIWNSTSYIVATDKIEISFHMVNGIMAVTDRKHTILEELLPISYTDYKSTQMLKQRENEYFFGGGMQNGRFTHKGKVITIVNTNNWVDGGVTSPNPFYWSTNGYGVLRNTWQPGVYDFGTKSPKYAKTVHRGEEFDAFYFINSQPRDILNDYYELTGKPLLMPEYAFYEAHLNAFNRDYWVQVSPETPRAILFEDGCYYKSYQPKEIGDKKGILESLNGENNNYQFSARGMIDRYKMHDMPLGWFVPNDGYGSGYGQTDSLDGDIENLKEFADYARLQGIEAALWTESNLHPADPENPKKGERDLEKEVSVAGVVALKCDVAWIGSGYSFGLNAVEDATNVFNSSTTQKARPMIIMVDGWAGTQRYSGIWSGDQKGGEWEYIRFHIPTYIGCGLSGQPVIGSDMDGIYAGGDREVNIRDYQWKTFTPLQLNMDGWGDKQKTPFAFDAEATTINRAYLKLKSMLMPYNYTVAHESIEGLPMIRAMLLEFPNEFPAYTTDSQYQFMWGPYILVAPKYNDKEIDDSGNSVRNTIFLPDENQVWVDFFTGDQYLGGKFWNNFLTPLWKIPVFIKSGAILPMVNPNNNPTEIKRDNRIFTLYPDDKSSFEVYEDDGMSTDYQEGHFAKTSITMMGPKTGNHLYINIGRTLGTYNGMVKVRSTLLQVMTTTASCSEIKAAINGFEVEISEAKTENEFNDKRNAYFFKEDFIVNPYFNKFSSEDLYQKCLLVKIEKINVTENEIQLKIKDFISDSKVLGDMSINKSIPKTSFEEPIEDITPTTITLKWKPVEGVDFYEIERDGIIFTNITGNSFTFDEFKYESKHNFMIRSAKGQEVSEWSEAVQAVTKKDPYINTIEMVKVKCNLPCQPQQEVCNLTDKDFKSMWHTDWGEVGKFNPEDDHFLMLSFDLGHVYKINKVEYVPRADAGNGTFLELQYKVSVDKSTWTPYSNTIIFPQDETVKVIPLNGTAFRYMKVKVLNSVGGFGSGKQMLFYKEIAE